MDDVISRQAAIDAAIEAADEWDGGYNLTRASMIADAINNIAPSVQPEPQWIPVGKKYPPVDEEVLVTYSVDRRKRRYVDIAHWSGNDWLSMLDEYRVPGHAIRYHAWKPLPKPYKGGKQ